MPFVPPVIGQFEVVTVGQNEYTGEITLSQFESLMERGYCTLTSGVVLYIPRDRVDSATFTPNGKD